jgi:hypothetical protein
MRYQQHERQRQKEIRERIADLRRANHLDENMKVGSACRDL